MNDFDLDARLKSIPLPEIPDDYWAHFPAQVRWNLHRRAPAPAVRKRCLPSLAWKLSASFGALVVGLLVLTPSLKMASHVVFQKEQFVRHQLAALPHQLRLIMTDEHGLHYLVAEKE